MECYQPVGSFKIRGIGRLCQYWVSQGKTHLVASSGGNAGVTVAYIGRKLGIKSTIFLPSTSHQIFVDAIKAQGAEVIIKGEVWDETHEAALAFCHTHDGAYIHPFDDPLIWAGHSTLVDELVDDNLKPDAIVTAVGGGGLACGILEGFHHYGWHKVPLFGVQSEGAPSFKAALEAGKPVKLKKINTIASTLGTKHVCDRLLEWTRKHPIQCLTVSDHQAIKACEAFLDDHRIFVEPACGVALAAVYNQLPALQSYQSILVIVCGGVGISTALFKTYLKLR